MRRVSFNIPTALGMILVAFLGLWLAYGSLIPPFENLDELEHFGVVWRIVALDRLPAHGAPEAHIYHHRQEASRPPLYDLSAGWAWPLGLHARPCWAC